ncbi:undecaprenyl-phosphate glucose phosphotransferase [Chitinophaga tropicalis]|uniref:Undecaprenyl-phosphate glucose phosphotransferase n=1 Tax=Chitinophaga tropicalis TaxID=2683588 RepID=A0A7K1U8L2_9BACT|nr:undecaprenyl-phosphate glucose phosphotransferase [Chitinophaga tropicalis]MVT10620.1 undecaprenyl-phosphate glucose phosphotransferase [Chitinophaga tropicalis]
MKQPIPTNQFVRQCIDYIVLTAAFLLTRHFIAEKGDVFLSRFNLLLLFISIGVWTVTGTSLRLYDDYNKSGSFAFEFVAILKTVLVHTCIFTFLFFYCFKYYPYPRTFTLLYGFHMFTGILITKYIVKKLLLRLQSHHTNPRNVLIVGTGSTGMSFYQTITTNNHYGYNCVGFVDEHAEAQLNGRYLGKISQLSEILEANEIDDVIVALPETQKVLTKKIISDSERAAKRVQIIADAYEYCTPNVSMNVLGNIPIVNIRSSPLDEPGIQRLKRAFDICFSLAVLVGFGWLFLLISILIRLTSKGPVFYKQERRGLRDKNIICYKFRSMYADSSEVDSNGQFRLTQPNDSRITPIGKFLRKTNLDELPQFFNVLIGNMSLVGPRPHATMVHIEAKETVQHYMLRQMVKPGITGWAQVNGCRGGGNTTQSGLMQKRVEMDIWYIEHYSFWLDCQIIFQTMMNMIKGDKNAY